ncbi:MAG TPA: high-potential iron-sulfur protein [Burkholderiales bacterium]|nr:high-potential iron-sulfur protein [Burkholderiales bacterium]
MSNAANKGRTRRALLGGAAALAGIAVLPRAARAAKASKAALKYQDHPHDGQDCDDCLQFIPGKTAKAMGECKVVEGPISPKGWCLAFVKK